ncbi:MAG: hypothetical protein P8R39_03105 [Alphaproteobacteria bacterium]|jgi:hypothetical protein|nr:hypothetical protein [Alphaproteobacteria bacterium]
MSIRDTLASMLTAAGFCDPNTMRLIWVNPAMERLLVEHGLERSLAVRALAPELPSAFTAAHEPFVREEATLPAHAQTNAQTAKCQLGPVVDVGGDKLLLFHLLERSGSDTSHVTLNIFSRHMNAREAAWEQERSALQAQIKELQSR